jgi:putative addiction module component (TIGR02574 family)
MATVLSMTWEQLLEKALQLPSADQEQLARALYENLADEDEDDDEDPAEVEAAWAEEIERRVEEIRNGTVETIPADVVFAEMRARFG